jgi:hypothetical protein
MKESKMGTLICRSLCAAIPFALLVACGDRKPAPAPEPRATPPSSSSSSSTAPAANQPPIVPPNTATDVESKKGTETGMVGGASGDVASGGKPGSGTAAGAGTGAAVSSGEKTENKK